MPVTEEPEGPRIYLWKRHAPSSVEQSVAVCYCGGLCKMGGTYRALAVVLRYDALHEVDHAARRRVIECHEIIPL